MYLTKTQKNKLTIGKKLRALKGLRKKDGLAKKIEMPLELKEYTEQLKQKGMKIQGLQYAMFETSNGLPYPGLIASKKILSNTIMLRVPVKCLLTTKVAFLSDVQRVFEENPEYYSKKHTGNWEDRILLTFLLYESQKGPKSEWFNLIRNLPKDIDYAIFWDSKSLSLMEDEWIEFQIQKQKTQFEDETKQLQSILKEYPELFDPSCYSVNQIKWIQTHLVTRCFGKYFEYTTMVPFAELFNHECVDVYYSMDYKEGNPHTQNEEFYAPKELSEDEMLEMDSSDGSYDASDYYREDEFFGEETVPENHKTEESVFVEHPETSIAKDVKSIKSYLVTFVNFNDSISLEILIAVFSELDRISKQKAQSAQQVQSLRESLKNVHSLNVKYVKLIKQFYAEIKSKYYAYGLKQKKNKGPSSGQATSKTAPSTSKEQAFPKEWKDDKFDDFVMLCSTKDQFEEQSQVYFCYGRLPNKLLLLRYGIALPHNKYNHLFLRLNIEEDIKRSQTLLKVVEQEVDMRKFKRFKLKRTKLCVELLTYVRSRRWQYSQDLQSIFWVKSLKAEIGVIADTKAILAEEMSRYCDSLAKNREKLTDKSLGYHEYFCLVYKVENQEILHAQMEMLEYANQTIQHLISAENMTLKDCLLSEKSFDKLTLQIMMSDYFETIKVNFDTKS